MGFGGALVGAILIPGQSQKINERQTGRAKASRFLPGGRIPLAVPTWPGIPYRVLSLAPRSGGKALSPVTTLYKKSYRYPRFTPPL